MWRALDASHGSSMPALRRCLPHSPYLRTSDDRILEYGWLQLLFSEQSQHQRVEIYKTADFGKYLYVPHTRNIEILSYVCLLLARS